MSMHTPQEWHSSAQFNMSQALSTQKKAHKQCDMSRRAQEDVITENLSLYGELHSTLESKVKTSHRLIEMLQNRAASVQDSISRTKNCISQLEAAINAKEAPLQLCSWRLEQRERRPLREQVRDPVEISLEDEKSTLVDCQRKLNEALRRAKGCLQSLETQLEELRHDIDQKTQALGVDEMCLRTTHRSFQTMVDRVPPSCPSPAQSRLPSTARKSPAHHAAVHESSKNEVKRQQEAQRQNNTAQDRENVSKGVREECAKLVAHCQRASDESLSRSEKMMQDRIAENQHVRRRLESEIRETHGKIEHTKGTMSETRTQLKHLEEPIELGTTCQSWRKQRSHREHILDPVSTKLQEHQMMLLQSHESLRNHHQQEKSSLQELQDRRERLKEDLRDKTAALHIDLNCMTHETAARNGRQMTSLSKQKLNQAMRVDPMFVPINSARVMSLSAR